MKKLALAVFAVMLAMLMLMGCTKKTEIDNNKTYVYYLNASATALYPVEIELASDDADGQIRQFIEAFLNVPQDVDALPALEEKVVYDKFVLDSGILSLYFDSNFAEMQPARRTLCVAALVYTLTQVDEVEYVSILSGDQPLTDSEGNVVRPLNKADFIDSISDVNAYERAELMLYFANEDGDALIGEKRVTVYSMNNALEKVALSELAEGPNRSDLKATLPINTSVINITTNEGTCYVTFSEDITQSMPELKTDMIIYSIVNTLTELPNISRVSIAFGDNVGQVYERNLDLLEGVNK